MTTLTEEEARRRRTADRILPLGLSSHPSTPPRFLGNSSSSFSSASVVSPFDNRVDIVMDTDEPLVLFPSLFKSPQPKEIEASSSLKSRMNHDRPSFPAGDTKNDDTNRVDIIIDKDKKHVFYLDTDDAKKTSTCSKSSTKSSQPKEIEASSSSSCLKSCLPLSSSSCLLHKVSPFRVPRGNTKSKNDDGDDDDNHIHFSSSSSSPSFSSSCSALSSSSEGSSKSSWSLFPRKKREEDEKKDKKSVGVLWRPSTRWFRGYNVAVSKESVVGPQSSSALAPRTAGSQKGKKETMNTKCKTDAFREPQTKKLDAPQNRPSLPGDMSSCSSDIFVLPVDTSSCSSSSSSAPALAPRTAGSQKGKKETMNTKCKTDIFREPETKKLDANQNRSYLSGDVSSCSSDLGIRSDGYAFSPRWRHTCSEKKDQKRFLDPKKKIASKAWGQKRIIKICRAQRKEARDARNKREYANACAAWRTREGWDYDRLPACATETYVVQHPHVLTPYCTLCDAAFNPAHTETMGHKRNLVLYGLEHAWVVFVKSEKMMGSMGDEEQKSMGGNWVVKDLKIPQELRPIKKPKEKPLCIPIAPWLLPKTKLEQFVVDHNKKIWKEKADEKAKKEKALKEKEKALKQKQSQTEEEEWSQKKTTVRVDLTIRSTGGAPRK